jgi:hypothetical protein
MSLSEGCQLFAAGRFFTAVTANVGRQASLGAWNVVLLMSLLVLVLVSVQQQVTVCDCEYRVLWCRPQTVHCVSSPRFKCPDQLR